MTPDFQIIVQNFNHTPIASFTTRVNELINANDDNLVETIPFPVNENISVELTNKTKLKRKYSFVDYLRHGVQIGLSFAIDYSSSNGDPNDKDSLHYTKGDHVNDYESAIISCGNIVSYYAHDKKYPVFGFGGNPEVVVGDKMCFNLNEMEDPEVHTIEKVRNVYRSKTPAITLSEPAKLGPVLLKLLAMVKQEINYKKYNIMMVLTNGQIDDIEETKSLLVEASKLPISLIIIGIGKTNFNNMIKLDSDDGLLKDYKGNQCIRDIVQFVPFNEYKNGEKLARAVLEELPEQVVEYYKYMKLSPTDLDANDKIIKSINLYKQTKEQYPGWVTFILELLDGRLVISSYGGAISLNYINYETKEWKVLTQIHNAHDDVMTSLCEISNKRIISSSLDKTIKI